MDDPTIPPATPDLLTDLDALVAKELTALRSQSPHTRTEAARRLGQLRAGIDGLLAALHDPNSFVRAAAVEALGRMEAEAQDAGIVDSLLACIDDPNDYVCIAALSSLGRLKVDASRDQILSCLGDPNPRVVSAAIQALGRLGPPELAEQLACFLDNPNPYVQAAAARACGLMGYAPAGPKLVECLETALQTERPQRNLVLVKALIEAISRLEVLEAAPLLVEIARHEVGLRSRCVQALVTMKADAAAPALASMLTDPSSRLREYLVYLMIEAGYEPALPIIRPLLKDSSHVIRDAALQAVAALHDTAALKQVRWMCFNDPNPFTRVRALHTLVEVAGTAALADLLALRSDPNTEMRLEVVKCLAKLAGPGLEGPGAEACAALQWMAGIDPPDEVAQAAGEALGKLGRPGKAPVPPPEPAAPWLPGEVLAQAPALLAGLEAWQAGLSGLAGRRSLEEIAHVDRALSCLIAELERGVEG